MDIFVKITNCGGERMVTAASGTLLTVLLQSAGISLDQPCGGRGVCGKCRIRASGQLSDPSPEEIAALGADLKKGLRLACHTRALGNCQIQLPDSNDFTTAVTAGVAQKTGVHPLYTQYGLSVDIGTTTLAAKLCHMGTVIAEAASKNSQTAFGADVLTRIGASLSGNSSQLREAVCGGINALIDTLCTTVGILPQQIDGGVITGNTAMLYLFTGRNPQPLAAAPFAADCLFGESLTAGALGLNLSPKAPVLLPPCISAFVGADITTAILASGLTSQPDTTLLADIGTNGEMALWHQGKLTCCSTAAGPAFEGAGIVHGMHGVAGAIDHVSLDGKNLCYTVIGNGMPSGICGSGIVELVAVMVAVGVLDEGGGMKLQDHPFTDRITQRGKDLFFELGNNIGLYGKDIRALQLAKSAIRAGLETLPELAGVNLSHVIHLWVAGGFGSYLDLDSSVTIGLIPAALRAVAQPVGNAALSGATMLLEDTTLLERVTQLARQAQTLDLGPNPVFMERYLEHMGFESIY